MNTRTYPRTLNSANGAFRDATYATACEGLQQALLAKPNVIRLYTNPLTRALRWLLGR